MDMILSSRFVYARRGPAAEGFFNYETVNMCSEFVWL
jgi:hypothetical protein